MIREYFLTDLQENCTLNIDIDLKDEQWLTVIDNLQNIILKTSVKVLEKLNIFKITQAIEFSIILADNNFIHNLNKKYREADKPTNCLTFPSENLKPNKITEKTFLNKFAILGDIIFSFAIISQESKDQQKSFEDHFTHLLVHSLLHFFGYDHINEKDALIMEPLEIEILKDLGINSPYEE
jgi:probable rRNA maturation factor